MNDWVRTSVLFWFLKACIIKRNFSKTFSMFECFISFTNRKLKIRTSIDTSSLLIDSKISFSSSSTIFFARNAMNEESILVMILSIKLMYAIDAENFLDRSRSRLISTVNTAETVVWSSWCENSIIENTFDWSSRWLFSFW